MQRKKRSMALVLTVLALAALAVLVQGIAWAVDGNLPGGTSISVEITAPDNDTLVAYPPGDITLEGTASVGEGQPISDTLIIYVLDVSLSTNPPTGGTGCGGDQNGDGIVDSILDCEIAAAKALNDLAAELGTVGDVGVAVYGAEGAAADVGPADDDQWLTGPDTDADTSGEPDVEEVLSSAFSENSTYNDAGVTEFTTKTVGSMGTNFAEGLSEAFSIAEESDKPNKMMVFMSDGVANVGAEVTDTIPVTTDVVIYTFAVGTDSNCESNPGPLHLGSLANVSALAAAGGYCQHVEEVADLPELVPGVIASKLLSLTLSINGGEAMDISADATPSLPVTGPNSVDFSHDLTDQMTGTYEFCVTAIGSDAGGEGEVEDCIDVTVAGIDLLPPEATNELGYPPQTHTVTAVVAAGADGVAGVPVSITILSGPNAPGEVMGETDDDGMLTFTYSATQGLDGLGTDVIEACFVDDLDVRACDEALKHWVDTTPPEVTCDETTNPAGKNIPNGNKPGNPDGFFELTATDLVDPDPDIYVLDSGSGELFGPYPSGTKIKYTEAPGAPPKAKKMGSDKGNAGAIDVHIIGNGDAHVYAVDASENDSEPLECLVPPPPK